MSIVAAMRLVTPILLAASLLLHLIVAVPVLPKVLFDLRWIVLQGVIIAIVYAVVGIKTSSLWGEYGGDEGHYLCQAASLAEDRDLDIKNNLGFDPDEYVRRALVQDGKISNATNYVAEMIALRKHLHVSEQSRHGAWYSVHLPGLSFLLAPGHRWGMPFRQIVEAALTGLTFIVLMLMCGRLGITNIWAYLLGYALLLSSFWGVHSVRAVPEVLSALLVCTAVYVGLLKGLRTIGTAFVVAAVLGFLPWVHARFAVHALLISVFLVLHEWHVHRWRHRKALLAFCVFMGIFAILFISEELYRFEGGNPYDVGDTFFSYPMGGLKAFFSRWSLLFSFPLAVALIITGIRGIRCHYAFGLLTYTLFVAIILTASCTVHWTGGTATPGRYYISIMPLFIPLAASQFPNRSLIAQFWTIFLAVFCVSALLLSIINLHYVGLDMFGNCFQQIRNIPELYHLPFPFPATPGAWSLFIIGFTVVTITIISLPRLPWAIPLLLLATLGIIVFPMSKQYEHYYQNPQRKKYVATRLGSLSLNRSKLYRVKTPLDIFTLSNRMGDWSPLGFSTQEPPYRQGYQMWQENQIEPNGWEDKEYRWFTLCAPFQEKHGGTRLVRLCGVATPNTEVVFVIKVGNAVCSTLRPKVSMDGLFTINQKVSVPQGKGDIYLLMRINGSGTVYVDSLSWSPIGDHWPIRAKDIDVAGCHTNNPNIIRQH